MSAGTGIQHSEFNASSTEQLKLLQLWVFSAKDNVSPRYDQKSFDIDGQINTFVNIVSPEDKNDGEALWVHQQTFFNLGIFEAGKTINYKVNIPENGVYLFLIYGEIALNDLQLNEKDAIGITDFNEMTITIKQQSKILLVEVPMKH
jgi:redox-sensitive bicupin YhaK (pirin superfamily)